MPLTWKVFVINGAVLCAATLTLVVGPFSVSRNAVASEVVVLSVGLAVMLLTNALLLRSSLAPVDRVIREMATIDLLGADHRIDEPGSGPGAQLVESFNAMLERLETEQRIGNAKALAAQEAERNRIAQELHDEVGQSLTVVLLGLKQLEHRAPAELGEEIELLRASARSGLDDVRRVARRLRPGVLEDLGLTSALAALTTDFASHTTAAVRRVVAPGLPDLSPEAEVVVYRVAQEALTNAVRHAGAAVVELSLTRLGDHVVLEVGDDGRGREDLAADRSGGAGIRGMHERALLVNGDLRITSSERGGTRVRLSVPVPSP